MRILSVLVNYNSARDCLDVVRSLPETYDDFVHTIIVLDNASDPTDLHYLRTHITLFPAAKLVCSSANLGFGAGVNMAVAHVGISNIDFIQVLNCDIRVIDPQFTVKLVHLLQAEPQVAIVGPLVKGKDTDAIQDTILPELDFMNSVLFSRSKKLNSSMVGAGDYVAVPAINGVCFICRATAFDDVDGFDPDYFMYVEESDFCRRLGRHGWGTVFYNVTSIGHSFDKHTADIDWRYAIIRRNLALHLKKQGRPLAAAALRLIFAIQICRRHITAPQSFRISVRRAVDILYSGQGPINAVQV